MKLLKFPLLLLFFLLIALFLGGGLAVTAAVLNTPPGTAPEEGALFQINKGETSESVFMRLERERLIRSSLLLRIIAKASSTEGSLKTGIYRIKNNHSTLDVHRLLVSGKQDMKRVTIREGWTLKQIARLLEQEGLTTTNAFLQSATSPALLSAYPIGAPSAEGFLFPDTYYFPYQFPADEMVKTMIGTFFNRLGEIYPAHADLDKKTLFQKVIMASIVEREYRNEDEAPVIASVFYNRLKKSQNLESCATVAYILTELMGRPHPTRLFLADLAVKSPYNTYKNAGLPPGPIGNPGATALIAAFKPWETKYLFFVLKNPSDGTHEFSETFQKHLSAKEMYLKGY